MVERWLSLRVRRILMLVLVVMLAFGPITRAYADDFEGGGGASQSFNSSFGTVWYGPTASGLYVRYGVVANTRYDAAVYCCRGRSFDLNDLSAKKKSKLLNDGDFYQFAQLFNASKPELTDDWAGDASIVMAWDSARQLYGETYCWNARYTNDQKIRAQEAIEDVLNDDDTPSGGGSGGGVQFDGNIDIEDYMLIPMKVFMPDPSKQIDYIALPDNLFDALIASQPDTSKWCAVVYDDCSRFRVYAAINDNFTFKFYERYDGYTHANYCLVLDGASTNSLKYYNSNYSASNLHSLVDGEGAGAVTYENCYVFPKTLSLTTNGWSSTEFVLNRDCNYRWNGADVVQEPELDPEPPINWPDPPTNVTTDPPDVPTPGDPTTPTPPDPVDPTPGNPWIPIPDDDVTITGDDFQDLLDALNEHCIHLQNSIQNNISQLWDLQSDFLGTQFSDLFGQISDNFTWLGNDVITESYNDLKSYLHELFEWLSERMNFDVQVEGGQYDDTSVLYWLKQIWAKLPTGINSRPTDPVTNPDGWWDWLTQLLNNLAADLMALGHDKLAGVLETLNELRNKFPFSLPWDVAALLGLLVGVPECPEFDMPCYTVSLQGLQQVGTYHITLEPYETVWEGVKWIETLAFAVYLIMNTGGLMDMVTKTVRPR